MVADELRVARDGTGAFHRRHKLVAVDDTTVLAGVEDDMHHFELTLHHDGRRVTAIAGRAVRWPWSPCAEAPRALDALVGMPLDPFPAVNGGWADARSQCTHLFDLAAIAVAHAARHVSGGDGGCRSYLAVVPDWFEPPYDAWILRDGSEVLRWRVGPSSTIVEGPAPFPGARLNRRFVEWCREHLDDHDVAEAALLLRRAAWMSPARHMALESIPTIAGTGLPTGVCYATQPERVELARRNRGSLRDYGTRPQDLLSPFPAP
ncbi:MAG TPA: hypothetical protein VF183_11690 [Acidimicrobiales bacterium]